MGNTLGGKFIIAEWRQDWSRIRVTDPGLNISGCISKGMNIWIYLLQITEDNGY